ncbi:hypothetical protein [Mesobacillus harenae]|uniref:hypothetical protein n=1 Tax=Mesobacillus harenae TaxID=2213203 RepID=UPI00158058C6|nr:hypothetical protein [Mesobacillus harenae]
MISNISKSFSETEFTGGRLKEKDILKEQQNRNVAKLKIMIATPTLMVKQLPVRNNEISRSF